MPLPQLKYNPGFRGDEELIRSFVVRQTELALILETIRENNEPSNQHLLIVGPRGSGKTTLVRRVAAELRSDPDFSGWYPIVFAEESYPVTSAGEFWLEALFHLGEQTQEKRWSEAYEELQHGPNDAQLRDRALAQLMNFADEIASRLLLIVENLNMLLGEQLRGSSDWNLRHTLQNEPRVMLLGTATSRFAEIESVDKAWFELLAVRDLRPLDLEECRTLWKALTDTDLAGQRIRPIQILTGGNPRLLVIMGEFADGKSFRTLMNRLVQLVDTHTEYFKNHLDGLPPLERKVFVAMLDHWDPASAQQIARETRMSANKASSLLGRLVNRGALSIFESEGRKRYYQVAERLYNVYYLMRRRTHPASRVSAAIRFMVILYDDEQLASATAQLAAEACGLPVEQREDHHWAYHALVMQVRGFRLKKQIIEATPKDFLDSYGSSTASLQIIQAFRRLGRLSEAVSSTEAGELIAIALSLKAPGGSQEAETAARQATVLEPENPWAWYALGLANFALSKHTEAEDSTRKSLALIKDSPEGVPNVLAASCWHLLGELLHKRGAKFNAVERAYHQSIQLSKNMPGTWLSLGQLLQDQLNYAEAESAYRNATRCEPEPPQAWAKLGQLLHEELGRYEEAEEAYQKAIRLDPHLDWAWAQLGLLLHEKLNKYQDAESAYREAVRLNPSSDWVWTHLGGLLSSHLSRHEEAEYAYRRAIEIDPKDPVPWLELGGHLSNIGRHEAAKQALIRFIEIDPEFALAWTRLGWTEEQLSQDDKAERAYRKAVDLDAEDFFAWSFLGQLLLRQSRLQEAERALSRALSLNSDSADLLNNFGALMMETSRVEPAEEAFRRALEIDPNIPEAWINLAISLGARERYPEAVQVLEEALELNAGSAEIWESMGVFLGNIPSRIAEAEHAFLRAIELDPARSSALQSLGVLLLDQPARLEEAERAIRGAIDADPKNEIARGHLAQFLFESERYEEAETALREGIAIGGKYVAGFWTNLGLAYQRQSRFEEARWAQKNAVQLDAGRTEFWVNLGLANQLTSRYDEALEAFKRATEIDPKTVEAWTYLAELLHRQRQYSAAEAAYLKAVELDDKDQDLRPGLFKLYLERGDDPAEVIRTIRGYLHDAEPGARNLRRLSEAVRIAAPREYLLEAESWVRQALEGGDDDWELTYELCTILGVQGRWPEALEGSELVIEAATREELAVHAVAELFMDAAAAGYAEQALRVLSMSTGRHAVEALVVGLQIYLGETPRIAQEIAEVAQDVVQKIRERSDARVKRSSKQPDACSAKSPVP